MHISRRSFVRTLGLGGTGALTASPTYLPGGPAAAAAVAHTPAPNVRHHWRIVSYVTLMPRSARRSSTSRTLRLNRWYKPHRVTDDFRRESVSSVARHTATVPRRHSS